MAPVTSFGQAYIGASAGERHAAGSLLEHRQVHRQPSPQACSTSAAAPRLLAEAPAIDAFCCAAASSRRSTRTRSRAHPNKRAPEQTRMRADVRKHRGPIPIVRPPPSRAPDRRFSHRPSLLILDDHPRRDRRPDELVIRRCGRRRSRSPRDTRRGGRGSAATYVAVRMRAGDRSLMLVLSCTAQLQSSIDPRRR